MMADTEVGLSGLEIVTARIPSTGEELLRVGLCTYHSFDVGGDKKKREELTSVLKAFVDQGGSLLDSSPMYGSSERVVGELSQAAGLNDRLFMATKVWIMGRTRGINQMNESLELFKRKRVDLMQIHNLVDWKTHLATLRRWKEEDLVRYIGITHYASSAFGEMEQILKRESLDFIQIPYSLFVTSADDSLIPLAAQKGVAVIANVPFGQGSAFKAAMGKPIPGWALEMGIVSWAQFFLKFILASKDVQFVIPATGNLAHLNENMQAVRGSLPDDGQRRQMQREFGLHS